MAGYWIDGRAEPTPGLDSGTRIGRNLLEGLFIGRSPGESGRGGDIDKTWGKSRESRRLKRKLNVI